jgi:hypothetical protein
MRQSVGYILVACCACWSCCSVAARSPKHSDEDLKHFYIYNECYLPISSTVTLVPSGSTDPATSTLPVLPGHQTLLGTTNGISVDTQSVSQDGKLQWSKRTFSLSGLEYMPGVRRELEFIIT